MKTYTVYRIDFLNNTKVAIGSLVERRSEERAHNETDLLRLAQDLFAESSFDRLHITVSADGGEHFM